MTARTSQPAPAPDERARIIAAARAMVEAGGVEALSMRKLAAELGVAHTAIYWHVGGRDELVAAIIDAFLADLGDITPRGRTPRQRMASVGPRGGNGHAASPLRDRSQTWVPPDLHPGLGIRCRFRKHHRERAERSRLLHRVG